MKPTPSCSCERCAQLQREYELYEQLIAAQDAEKLALQELRRLQEARIADLERRHRDLTRRPR